ncbi:hypothetical protein [Streptomyces sp. NPDC013740]|uniref:hypothetical protein n=1 Tax=Streptomyces sp. NPDC013740 TaxID=3364867 RepID=UPI003702E7A3
MSAEEATAATEAEGAAEAQPSKLAGGCVLAIGVAVAGGVAYTVPETAYFAAGLMATTVVSRARGWVAGRREKAADEQLAEDVVDIVAALHALSPAAAGNVRLTQLQEYAGLPDARAVRALLTDAGIEVKEVRAGGKTGPGVYRTAIPRSCNPDPDGCWCAVTSNNNTNNTPAQAPEEGLRVEAIGAAGVVYRDPTETQRRHTKTPARNT